MSGSIEDDLGQEDREDREDQALSQDPRDAAGAGVVQRMASRAPVQGVSTGAPPQEVQPQAQPQQGQPQAPQQAQPGADSEIIMVGRAPAKAEGKTTWADYGKAIWQSTMGMGEQVLGAASMASRALGANPQTVQHIEEMKKGVADHIEESIKSMSPAAQASMHSSIFGGQDANGEHIPTPGETGWTRFLALNASEFVPPVALALLTRGMAARLGVGIAGQVASTAGAFGTLQMGGAYNDLVKMVDSSGDALAKTEAGKAFIDGGGTLEDYKKQVVAHIAPALGAIQFGIGAITGGVSSELLMRGAIGTLGKTFMSKLGLAVGEGAATMGVQTGGGEAAQQGAGIKAGLQPNFDTDKLARAAASGIMTGAAMGGMAGVVHGRVVPDRSAEETQTTGKSTGIADQAINQALNTQLELPGIDQAGPGTVATNPQGQLFRTAEEANARGSSGAGVRPDGVPPGGGPGPGGTSVQPGGAPTDTGAVAAPVAPAAPAQAEIPGLIPQPTVAGVVSVGPTRSGPRPSDGLKRQDLIDGVQVATGADAKTLRRMTVGDLRDRFDAAHPAKQEAAADTRAPDTTDSVAQLRAPDGEVSPENTTVGEPTPDATPKPSQAQPKIGHPAAIEAAKAPEATHVDHAAAQAEVPKSPEHAAAGNYQKGHADVGGLDVSIETPRGGVRKGVGPDGTPWEATMPGHYGYIKKTTGADGEHVDVTLGPHAHEVEKHSVYVIDQKDPHTGKFDEHKAMLGYATPVDALHAYDASFSDGSGPARRGAANSMSFGEFKEWLGKGETGKAISYKPTVSDQLKARRAAQKAKMAAPGERVRGTVATVEAPEGEPTRTSGTEKSEPRTREQAIADVQKVVRESKVVPLTKGGDITRAIERAVGELRGHLNDTKTEGDVAEAVAKWARSSAGPIPGTRTRRIEIGDQVMRLLTGKTVDEFSGRAQRVRAELATGPRPPSVYESEGAARKADVEAAHAREVDQENAPTHTSEGTVSEGVTQIEGKATPEPTKIVDKLPWWLDRVRQGEMTVQEAAEAYGSAKGTGRPRQFKSFSDYLDAQIAHAEDPAAAEDLRKRLTQLQKRGTSQAVSAETARVNDLLEHTGKEAAGFLRELKAELDPVKAEADKIDPPEQGGGALSKADQALGERIARTNGGQRAVDQLRERLAARKEGKSFGQKGWGPQVTEATYRDRVHDPRVNRVVNTMLDSGEHHTLHDYLRAIGKDEVINSETPELASLARRMLTLTKDDITVNTNASFTHADGSVDYHGGLFRPGLDPGTGTIGVERKKTMSSVETLLHEGMHSITAHYLESLPRSHPDRLALEAMANELHTALHKATDLSPGDRMEIDYALSNDHELHTMLMTNPAVQRLAASHTPSYTFREQMRGLGYALDVVKSVWAAFTNLARRALGLGLKGPMNGREASLMDHVLRPIQDITDRAAAFNRSPPADIQFVASRAMPDFRSTKDELVRHLPDAKTWGDTAARTLLQGATTDGIVKWNEKRFERADGSNPLHDYRKAFEQIEAAKTKFNDDFADRVAGWAKGLAGPERDKVAALIVDASTADVKLGRGLSNHAALQARYDALSAKGKASYDESHAIHDAMYARDREASLNMMLKGAMPDATKTQLDEVRDAASGKGKLTAFLADPDNSAIAAKFGAEWKSVRTLVKGIAEIHQRGFINGDYFPLNHDGDYIVHYGEKGQPGYGMEAFTTVGAAEARRAELAKQGVDALSPVMSKRENFNARDAISLPAIDEVVAAMKRNGMDSDHVKTMHDLMASVAMQHVMQGAGTRARIRRQGVLGASKDVEKIAAEHMLATGARVGNMEHGVDRAQALQRMQDHTDELGRQGKGEDQRVAQAVTNEMQKRVPKGDYSDNMVSKIVGKANAFGYAQSLMSFSHIITSTTEAHMNSTARLGARHGPIQATVALGKALKDSMPVMITTGTKNTFAALGRGLKAADWNLSTVVRDRMIVNGADKTHMTKLFDSLNAAGLIDHTFVRELKQIANPGAMAKARGMWGKFMDFSAASAHAVDVANKSAIAKAAFDLEMRKSKGDVAASIRYATDETRSAMPNYNSANKARIATAQGAFGGLAMPITQFKQYGIHQYSMLAGLVHTWRAGATAAERREAGVAFAGVMATHMLMAGVIAGSPLGDVLRWAGGAYDLATGETKPHDYQTDVRSFIAEVFGPELGELIARGVPHAAGIDIHRRVGTSNLLEPPELKSFDKAGMGEAMVQAVLGASGQDAAVFAQGLSKLFQGDMVGGAKDMVPRIIRDPMKAWGLATDGVTSKGKTILPADKISTADVIRQAVGFQPSQVSEFRERRAAIVEARDEAKTAHDHIVSRWLKADPEDRADMADHIRAFNTANPGEKITHSTLLQALARQKKTTRSLDDESLGGLTIAKKMRGQLSGAGAFANVQ